MEDQANARRKELCAQAAVEQDPTKLISLVTEINGLLEEKEQGIKTRSRVSD